jgi:hypothetical protein
MFWFELFLELFHVILTENVRVLELLLNFVHNFLFKLVLSQNFSLLLGVIIFRA